MRPSRAGLASDHPCRADGCAGGLLHLDLNGFERQSHQRSCDFRLGIEIVGNSHRGENGFIQRGRIAPDAASAILRHPVFAHRRLSF